MSGEESTVPTRQARVPVRDMTVEVLRDGAVVARHSASDRITVGRARSNDVVIEEPTVSQFHLELCREGARIRVVDLGSANGTAVDGAVLSGGSMFVRPGAMFTLGDARIQVVDGQARYAELDAGGFADVPEIVGLSAPTREVAARVRELASNTLSVLLEGESGTGKEVVARALHRLSGRKGALVTVDCGSLPRTLIASELFGHARGAFTGADRERDGALARADGGTLFLDEIGELPLEDQTMLLGALERRRFARLGDGREQVVDVRVVSATNRDLRAAVNHGGFRLDLYYRLAVVELSLRPLRDRRDDIRPLVEHFAQQEGFTGDLSELFDEDLMELYERHRWPGNVRELRNAVLGAVAMGRLAGVPRPLVEPTPSREAEGLEMDIDGSFRDAKAELLERFERRFLERLLERSEGNVRAAARLASMHRSHLIGLLDKHGLR